ncbi:MAG: nucleoside-diphosphate kinase [Ignavibacteria bacterium]|nr:nucleoside-diphosphate kinase [Ignavibacteria bacterium]
MCRKTLVMLKPDALERNLAKVIEDEIEKAGLLVSNRMTIIFKETMIFDLWPDIYGEAHIQQSIEYLAGKKLPVWLVVGEDAIDSVNRIKRQLRHEYCSQRLISLFHAPDTPEEYLRACKLFLKNRTV